MASNRSNVLLVANRHVYERMLIPFGPNRTGPSRVFGRNCVSCLSRLCLLGGVPLVYPSIALPC